MQTSDSPALCPACGGRSRISSTTRTPAGQQRYRRCRRCSESWVTVEMPVEDHRATTGAIEDLRARLEQVERDLRLEREARMDDIRAAVRTVGRHAVEDATARLFVEYMKTRAEFLASSSKEEQGHLKGVG